MARPPSSLRGARATDRFRRLFDDHHRLVLAFALRRTSVRADADDVVSETFAVAWRRLDEVPEARDQQVSWLLATARRVLANTHRATRRRAALQMRVEATSGDLTVPDATESAGDVELVRAALASLGDPDQEILRLAVWDELSHAQIAAVLDLTVSAVSVRLHRARGRLAEALASMQQPATGGGA